MTIELQSDMRQLSDDYALVEKAIAFLDLNASSQPELADVARAVGVSEFHFQRTFTRWAGISPKRFLQFLTRERARLLLERSENLLDTTFQLGLSSPGRLHDLFVTTEAVTPGQYKSRGVGLTIRYGVFPTPFGSCLLGVTERGVCHLGFVQGSEGDALDEMVDYWQQARIVEDNTATAPLVDSIFRIGRAPVEPLHILLRGTNFQIKVWEALLRIPSGSRQHLRGPCPQHRATPRRASGRNCCGAQSDPRVDPLPPGHSQAGRIWQL